MTLWAIVPFKSMRRAKSRLAPALDLESRQAFSRSLLVNTLETLGSASCVDTTLVVSRDAEALEIARSMGATPLVESGEPDLNRALSQAEAEAVGSGASALLILPADLPCLGGSEIERLTARALKPPVAVVAPDRRGDGTNALLVSPPGLIEFSFGTGSYRRHCELARRAGASLEVCDLPGLALDIDLVEDLDLLCAGRSAPPTGPRGAP